jgi:hypothetical protein
MLPRVMNVYDQLEVQFQLSAPSAPSAEVRLRVRRGRWLAATDLAGQHAFGIGSSPRQALTASLAPFGAHVAAALLADPELFAVSTAVAGL